MKFQSLYDYEQVDKGIDCSNDEPITQQQFTADVDINNIVNRFLETGFVNPLLVRDGEPVFGDVSTVIDYKESLDYINEAKTMFEELPAKIRDRFNNDPFKLLEFVADDKNYKEAQDLGLVEPKAHLLLDVNVPTDTNKEEPKK